MFVRCKVRRKDGKEWSVVEDVRVRGGRVAQRQVFYLGEINDSQRAAWCRSIAVLDETAGARQLAPFPADRAAPALHSEVVQILVTDVQVRERRHWGACCLALTVWDRLELDRQLCRSRTASVGLLPASRESRMRACRVWPLGVVGRRSHCFKVSWSSGRN